MPKNPTIPTLGLILASVGLALGNQNPANPQIDNPAAPAQAKAAAEVVAPPTEAEKTIDTAILKLKEFKSAEADIKVTADMLNQKFQLVGNYKRKPGNRVFLKLSLVGSADSSDLMLQVCDGVTLWDFTKVLDSQSCSKKSIVKIMDLLNSPDCDAKIRDEILSGLGFAGPESVLTGLRKSFLIDQTRDGEWNGKPVWILGGTWKDAKTPVNPGSMGGGPQVLGGPLPSYIPSLVSVYVDKETGWPYQVVFEGRLPVQIEKKKQIEDSIDGTGRTKSPKLIATPTKPSKLILVYSNVKLNTTINDEIFAFAEPDPTKTRDETESFVTQLKQVIEAQVAKKSALDKAQAIKSGPVLEGGLTAPAPGADAPVKPPLESSPKVPK